MHRHAYITRSSMRSVYRAHHIFSPLINRVSKSKDRIHTFHQRSTRTMATGHSVHKTNRLAQEQSAYLLQHAENPVEWFPWSEEAFALARQRDCPIFLSIGYSSCHWCHVMEHESFESEEIADILNKNYVSIKVDKEERPDVDRTFMSYIQATQGGGGWPMSVFLTPDLHPFFGGTYFPPEDGYGRPGFKTVLNRLSTIWNQKKEEIKVSSADSMRQLSEVMNASAAGGPGGALEELLPSISLCAKQFEQRFDSRLGGFGGAPKFPRPSELLLLMTEYTRLLPTNKYQARRMLHMATFTLKQMAAGGMRDQLGGGFHRYSVDEYWHVPHFEIMLYDNPQLVQSNLAAFQITRDLSHASVARGVLDYLLRDLKHPEGGFCAAEDADSLDVSDNKKKEGQFYIWTKKEIDDILGGGNESSGGGGGSAQIASMFESHYGVKPEGNCTQSPRSDPHHEFQGKNVLYQAKTLEETAAAANLSIGETEEILSSCREKLFKVRTTTKPRPFRDEKILTAWNGMAIGAFAAAGRVLNSEDPPLEKLFPVEGRAPSEYIQAAKTAVECIRTHLYDPATGQLRRAYMNGPSAVHGFSDDYAHMISGLLELYCATGEVEFVQWAIQLQEKMDELFWDETGGGYFQSPISSTTSAAAAKEGETSGSDGGGESDVLFRIKEDYDGAEPAASSIAVSNLWKLAALSSTQKASELRKQAEKCAGAFSGQLKETPSAMPQMCTALHLVEVGHARQVVIAGRRSASDTESLINAAYSVYAPDMVIIHLDLSDDTAMEFWKKHNPEAVSIAEATGMTIDEPATAFICQNFTCKKPTTDPEVVRKTLEEVRSVGVVARQNVDLPFKKQEG